ncbi:hypothetical protein G2W53_021322 [Senna tora]|uniref:Uncharacterized protein n=1 Tax=Senna tora TaxID=362788 RepID=A0A834TJC5_9FABA|nr:hypothetical protein G2W53_021322 [Senna tora]
MEQRKRNTGRIPPSPRMQFEYFLRSLLGLHARLHLQHQTQLRNRPNHQHLLKHPPTRRVPTHPAHSHDLLLSIDDDDVVSSSFSITPETTPPSTALIRFFPHGTTSTTIFNAAFVACCEISSRITRVNSTNSSVFAFINLDGSAAENADFRRIVAWNRTSIAASLFSSPGEGSEGCEALEVVVRGFGGLGEEFEDVVGVDGGFGGGDALDAGGGVECAPRLDETAESVVRGEIRVGRNGLFGDRAGDSGAECDGVFHELQRNGAEEMGRYFDCILVVHCCVEEGDGNMVVIL